MSNLRDKRQALRDERRAAIKAAVTHANAITQSVVFPDRTKVAKRRQRADRRSTRRMLARSDGPHTVQK
jgi:hypothetical protein